jgi:hypothetical protein
MHHIICERKTVLNKRGGVMKKIISGLVVLAMVATPCLAEVKPESFFSLNGTVWNRCYLGLFVPPMVLQGSCHLLSFYQGRMYECDDASGTYCSLVDNHFYIDLGVLSILWGIIEPSAFELAIIQPIGLGFYTSGGLVCGYFCTFYYAIGIMYKVNDNWTPPEIE